MAVLSICGVLCVLALLVMAAWRRRTARAERLEWPDDEERDWSADELELLRSSEVAA